MKLIAALALSSALFVHDAHSRQAVRADDPPEHNLHISFGVYQTDKATEMYKLFTPFLESLQDDLSKRLDEPCSIELAIYKSYDDAIDALVSGKVDFVHFGPASYVIAKERNPDIKLLAMEHDHGEKTFKGVIVVAKNSPIQRVEDLRGKRFAFGDRNSTIGRYLVQAELATHGVHAGNLASFKYLERHDQVASAVEHGDFDAGSVKVSTFKRANERGTLRALATFDNVTKPVVARAGLDTKLFSALQVTLFACKEESYFKAQGISGFTTASDDDYKFVREGMKKASRFEQGLASE